jgi:TonB-linked SusC/RagA family outer membrane protein
MIGIQRGRTLLSGFAVLAVVLGLPAQAFAQNAVVRGTVTSADRNEPIPGVNVVIAALNISVLTNDRGAYNISIPAARIPAAPVEITARAIGFKAVIRGTLIRAGEQEVNFTLQTDINRLEEIIVTGVMEGVERAKVPFAVGRVTLDQLPVPPVNPLNSLQGKVAGVRIAQITGKPGATPEIMLRGPTSINASGRGQGPLIIVDDAIMNVGVLQELGGLDIESVEVVKGAAGASLYGTRAANGVVMIRTKRGLTGEDGVRFNVRTEVGVSDWNTDFGQSVYHHMQLDETGTRFCTIVTGQPGCSRTIEWMKEILRINNVNADTTRSVQNVVYNNLSPLQLRNVYKLNQWPGRYYLLANQILTRNPVILTSADATGKLGNVSFYVSGSVEDQAGAIRFLNGIQQRRGRVNLDYNVRPDLRLSVSTMFDDTSDDLQDVAFGAIMRGSPPGTDQLARDSLGRLLVRAGGSGLMGSGNGGGGIFYNTFHNQEPRTATRFLGSLNAKYFPAEWVTFEGVFAYDTRSRTDADIIPKGYRTQTISTTNNPGNIEISNLDSESFNASLTATFRPKLREDLDAKLSFRGIYDQFDSEANSGFGIEYLVADINQLSNTRRDFEVSSSSSQTKNTGVFAGLTLDYKDRYIFEGSFRYDGSSRFGSGNRWAPFGRVSGVWRVSEEPWWNVGPINEFRLRASRGTAGTTPPFSAQYEVYNVSTTGISLDQAGNRSLRPETTTEYEVGTDLELFNRVGLELTYASGTTRDQILPVGTPAALGFTTQWQNAGTLVNKTWEVAVTVPIVNSQTFYWQMRGTWDRTRTYITELNVPPFTTGTLNFFMTDSREKQNGFPLNRFGNIRGRKFYKTCSDLPAAVQPNCGEGKAYQVDNRGWVVWVGEGNSWREGITRNLWETSLPAAESPWCYTLNFGHPIVDRPLCGEPGQGVGRIQVLGNALPDFRFTFTNDIQWKRLTLYALFDGTIGHEIYNEAEQWGLFDYSSARFDFHGETVETAKPVGYSWRVGPPEHSSGIGGFYDILGPNNYSVEDGSYAKLREVSLTYKLGPIGGVGDWTVGLIGRNLLTITGFSGFDPEVGVSGGTVDSGFINSFNAAGDPWPQLRTFTVSLATRF